MKNFVLLFMVLILPVFAQTENKCEWIKKRIVLSDTILWCWEKQKDWNKVRTFEADKSFMLELYKFNNCNFNELTESVILNTMDGTVGECEIFTPKIYQKR